MTTMDRVLLSVRAQWCDLITSGKRTIDIRKTKPNIETPFRMLYSEWYDIATAARKESGYYA